MHTLQRLRNGRKQTNTIVEINEFVFWLERFYPSYSTNETSIDSFIHRLQDHFESRTDRLQQSLVTNTLHTCLSYMTKVENRQPRDHVCRPSRLLCKSEFYKTRYRFSIQPFSFLIFLYFSQG